MIFDSQQLRLYVHIPFCVRKCRYCDFVSFADTSLKESYFKALTEEIVSGDLGGIDAVNTETDSIFFGGGTPSCVAPYFIDIILCKLNKRFNISKNAEISIEINPGTVDINALHNYKAMGINRLSIGIQSFNDNELKALGRIHDSKESLRAYDMAREAGFNNINIDLMSSIPFQTAKSFEKNLEMVKRLEPEHVSCYSLIIEEGTPFYEEYKKGNLTLPTEDEEELIDDMTISFLNDLGYLRYEVSNYSKRGMECRHNMGYWKRDNYRGFGVAAASLLNSHRFTSENSIKDYIEYASSPFSDRIKASENRILSRDEEMEEFMFLGLRMTEGVNAVGFKEKFGSDIWEIYGEVLKKNIELKLLENTADGQIFLTEKGISISNPILAQFLL